MTTTDRERPQPSGEAPTAPIVASPPAPRGAPRSATVASLSRATRLPASVAVGVTAVAAPSGAYLPAATVTRPPFPFGPPAHLGATPPRTSTAAGGGRARSVPRNAGPTRSVPRTAGGAPRTWKEARRRVARRRRATVGRPLLVLLVLLATVAAGSYLWFGHGVTSPAEPLALLREWRAMFWAWWARFHV